MSTSSPPLQPTAKPEAYGLGGLGLLERTGVWLRTRAVRAHLRAARPATILDVGCGHDARVIRMVLPSVRHAVGIDLSVSDAAKALPATTFHEGWIDEQLVKVQDGSCDLVTMLSVLEHLEEPQAALRELHRVLAPAGTAMVHVPTWVGKRVLEPMAFRLGKSTDSIDDHKMYYGARDLWPMLVKAGFRPRDIRMRYHTGGCALLAVARRAT